MKILHYSLGFPPYRTGGLTKYCMDLMFSQKKRGHDVALLWPGQMGFICTKLSIRNNRVKDGIQSFEIINPLPVSLDEGITDFKAYTANGEKGVYKKFLEEHKPDAIHIHTLMGLHKEFLIVAKEMDIKTVFTTHDYFGLCPTVTFFHNGHNYIDDFACVSCIKSNQLALSLNKIKLMQSPIYRLIKNTATIKFMRRRHRKKFLDHKEMDALEFLASEEEIEYKSNKYKELRQHYIDMYGLINFFHFNSTISEMVYKKYLQPQYSSIISITHNGISDHRKKKEFIGKLKITYLSPTKPFKGFDVLKEALDELWREGCRDFELNIFNLTNDVGPYMNVQDGYQYSELEEIFNRTDILIAPSVCYETFGFTVIEALSYGVPVMVSNRAGVSDLISNNINGLIINANVAGVKEALITIIEEKKILEKLNANIIKSNCIKSMDYHVNEMLDVYALKKR